MCDQETCRLAESVVVSRGGIVFMMSSDVYTKTDECSWWNSAEKRATDWFLPFLSIRHESAGGSLEVSVRAQIWNCVFVVFVCFRLSLFFLLWCGVLFVCNFPTTRPELSWLCVSFGGFFFFSALVFFCRLSQPERQRNKSETPTKTKCWSLSQQLHTAHSCYANFRNHCFIPSLWIHIYTFFSYSSLSLSLLLASKTNHKQLLSRAELDCCVLILQTDWLLKFRSLFILQCRRELISPLVLFVRDEQKKPSSTNRKTDQLVCCSLYQYSSRTTRW